MKGYRVHGSLDLLTTATSFTIGSSTTGRRLGGNTYGDVRGFIMRTIKHNLFDWEFYYNYADHSNKVKYWEMFDKTVAGFVEHINDFIATSIECRRTKWGIEVVCSLTKKECSSYIRDWFKQHRKESDGLWQDWVKYNNHKKIIR
jgi:hypothetical protein